jgi:hypothetical protein
MVRKLFFGAGRACDPSAPNGRPLLFSWRADRIGTPRSQETQKRKIRLAIRWPLRQPAPLQIGI